MGEQSEKQAGHDCDDFIASHPEPKLELLDGRLLVGNGLAGSRLLLRQLLCGWGAEAAVALGSLEQWSAALCAAYGFTQSGGRDFTSLERQASAVEYRVPDLSRGREGQDGGHRWVRQELSLALFTASKKLGGRALGRDFVMKLGEDGFTPDVLFFTGQKLNQLYEYYLGGPAELVIEVLKPAHQTYDREVKRELYARGGVPEYVVVDPAHREVEFFRLAHGDYQRARPDADGKYRPQSVPGLAMVPANFWSEEGDERDPPFLVEKAAERPAARRGVDDGLGWGSLPFEPRLALQPERIRFAEYISWCPEAKFECLAGRPEICGRPGVRNLLGMLAMTCGLIEVCRLAAPRQWVAAFQDRLAREARDRQLRDEWWHKARRVAALLREQYGLKRVGVTGDLLDPKLLNYWSELTLVAWGMPRQEYHNIYCAVSAYEDESAPEIVLHEGDSRYFKKYVAPPGAEVVEL